MKSWRTDPRFQCPDCHKPIRIAIASANRLTDVPSIVAVCPACNRFFEEKEWRRRPGPGHPRLSDIPF